jgi:hypothetical protein
MSELNTKILVCCHKKDIMATQPPYFPIHVGKALSDKDLGIQGDNQGDNISEKNQSYCELTGLYWAWKNLKNVDIIGLCHYRRYFDFHNQCRQGFPQTVFPSEKFSEIDLTIPENILGRVKKGEVVMAKPRNYRRTLVDEYCYSHVSDDLRILQTILKESEPQEIQDAYFKIMIQGNELRHYNMFLMRWSDFDEYCTWLFKLLQKVEEKTDITHYDPVQKRIYGYIAERMFNVWIEAKKKHIIEKPVIWFTDAKDILTHYNKLTYKLRCALNNLAFWILKPHKQTW